MTTSTLASNHSNNSPTLRGRRVVGAPQYFTQSLNLQKITTATTTQGASAN